MTEKEIKSCNSVEKLKEIRQAMMKNINDSIMSQDARVQESAFHTIQELDKVEMRIDQLVSGMKL